MLLFCVVHSIILAVEVFVLALSSIASVNAGEGNNFYYPATKVAYATSLLMLISIIISIVL